MSNQQRTLLQRIESATKFYEDACRALWVNPADSSAADEAQRWDAEVFFLREEYYSLSF